MKKCSKCKEVKILTDFNKNRSRKDGLNSYCRICQNRATARSAAKRRGPRSPVKTREDTRRRKAAYYKANRDSILEKHKFYRQNNLDAHKMREGNRRAQKKLSEISMPENWWDILIDFYGAKCMNPDCISPIDKWNVLSHDHVKPLSKGGSHTLDNSQILCRRCNCIKHANEIDFRYGKICDNVIKS